MSETINKPSVIFRGILQLKAKETAKNVADAIINGDVDPVYAGVMLKKFAKIQEIVNDNQEVKDLIINSVQNQLDGKSKTIEAYDSKIGLTNKSWWDYSETNDPYLEALEAINKKTSELIKLRKEQLQAKAAAWEAENDPQGIQEFGIRPFIVSWDRIPYLEWEEESGEVSTNVPIKKGFEILRYTV